LETLIVTSNGVGYSLCNGTEKHGSMMTQGLKLASEQAEGYFKIMAVKEAIQWLLILKKPSQHKLLISHTSAYEIPCK
jgi:hypothetical protein